MNGQYSIFNRSMNGITTISDGAGSFITDGQAIHDKIFFTDEVEATQGTTKLTQTEVITTNVNCDQLTATTTNIATMTADSVNTDRLIVYDASNNIITDLNGNNSTSTFNGVSNFNNTINVTNKNIVQTQTGIINQSGTGTNNMKDTNVNGFLVLGSNITQNGGSTSLKDVTCDALTLRSGKSITQSGTTDNTLSKTTVTELIILDAVTFPSNVTVPGTTTTDDIVMQGDSVIIQDLTVEPSGQTNILRNTKTLDLEVDGDLDMIKAGSSATLKNTTIQGSAEIQGDITQTTGSTILKTISCNNITLNADQNITQSGSGYITQSGTGTNTLKAIELTNNSNITFNGNGIISQPLNTSQNILNNFRCAGYGIVGGRNNTVYSNSQPCQNNNGLQLQYNRDNSSFYSFIMTNRGSGGNGGFRFQRYGVGTYIDEPLVIDDNITMNKNLQVPGGSITCASASLGNISQTELNCLDNCSVNIQTEFNLLSSEIDNLQASTSGNSTALTGISYSAGSDTTTVDNNLTVSAGKNLLVGGANILNLIDLNADDIIALNQRTTGMSYNGAGDRTTINNNVTMSGSDVTINGTLLVQGMDIKAEIDALETSITTGNLDTTNLTTNNLTVETNTRLGNSGGNTYIKGLFYFCDTETGNEEDYTQFNQMTIQYEGGGSNTFFNVEQHIPNGIMSFKIKNIENTQLIESLRINLDSVGVNGDLNVNGDAILNNGLTVSGITDFYNDLNARETLTVYKNITLLDKLKIESARILSSNITLTFPLEEYQVIKNNNINISVTLPSISTTQNNVCVTFIMLGTNSICNLLVPGGTLIYDTNRNPQSSVFLSSTGLMNIRLISNNQNWYIVDFVRNPNSVITQTIESKTASIITDNGQSSSPTLTVGDSKNGVDKSVIVVPNSNSGAYNPIVQTGDISVVGYGDLQNDGRMSISTWSNTKNGIRITDDSTTINGGDNFITVNPSSITIDSGNNSVTVDTSKTQVVGNFISRSLTPGYMYNGIGENYAILCSAKAYRPYDIDDHYYINPGFKFVIYQNDNYGGAVYTLKNDGLTPKVLAATVINRMNSIKVFYSDTPTNDNTFNEITMDFIS